MFAEGFASSAIDYRPCRYGASKQQFRGPAKPLYGDYVVCLGGGETFGRFLQTPYPDLIERTTGLTTINLGVSQGGIDAYLQSPGLLDICSGARATVIQVMGAAFMSNRLYTVDPRNNTRFLRAARRLKHMFPEVNFARIETVPQLLSTLAQAAPGRLGEVRSEVQDAWVARMRALLDRIEGRKVLLWLSDHTPYSQALGGTICREPLFVDRAMLRAIQGRASTLVEVVAQPPEISAGRTELYFEPDDRDEAAQALGPIVHARAARALSGALEGSVAALKRWSETPRMMLQA